MDRGSEALSFEVLYQDPWVLGINKKGYLPVAPTPQKGGLKGPNPGGAPEKDGSLLGQVREWLQEGESATPKAPPPTPAPGGAFEVSDPRKKEGYSGASGRVPFLGLVHRIDQPVTGVVLFARDPHTLEALNQQFREREVKKTYWAVTEAPPPQESGTLEHFLVFDPKRNRSWVARQEGSVHRGRTALLRYRLVGRSERYFFLEIDLVTGRTHQIRAQLAAIDCPVKGDLKYGARRSNPGGGIMLHARSIECVHPRSGEPLRVVAEPPPSTLWDLFPRSAVAP